MNAVPFRVIMVGDLRWELVYARNRAEIKLKTLTTNDSEYREVLDHISKLKRIAALCGGRGEDSVHLPWDICTVIWGDVDTVWKEYST